MKRLGYTALGAALLLSLGSPVFAGGHGGTGSPGGHVGTGGGLKMHRMHLSGMKLGHAGWGGPKTMHASYGGGGKKGSGPGKGGSGGSNSNSNSNTNNNGNDISINVVNKSGSGSDASALALGLVGIMALNNGHGSCDSCGSSHETDWENWCTRVLGGTWNPDGSPQCVTRPQKGNFK